MLINATTFFLFALIYTLHVNLTSPPENPRATVFVSH